MATQKVVIPKGVVNPNETTIVEIPKDLHDAGTVVARIRPDPNSPHHRLLTPPGKKKPSYRRRSVPKAKVPGFGYLHDAGTTFSGPYDEVPEPYDWSAVPLPHPPGYAYAELSPGDVSYRICQGGPKGALRSGIFDPVVGQSSTLADIDHREGSLYRDFRPKKTSSRPASPAAQTPGSMKRWHSSLGTVSPDPASEPEYSYEEPSGYEYESCACPEEESSGQAYSVHSSRGYSPAADKSLSQSSGGYRKFDSVDSPGGLSASKSPSPRYRNWDSTDSSPGTPPPPATTPYIITEREVMNSLGELEAVELSQIMVDLNKFQDARRRLVFDASSLASAADVSSSLLSSSGGSK